MIEYVDCNYMQTLTGYIIPEFINNRIFYILHYVYANLFAINSQQQYLFKDKSDILCKTDNLYRFVLSEFASVLDV